MRFVALEYSRGAGARASDRHRHVSLHRRRGLDEAPARARRRGVRGGARRASAVRCARRSRSTAASRSTRRGTRSSSRSRPRPGALAAAAEAHDGARGGADPACASGIHTGDAARDRRGLRRHRRPPRGADRRGGPRRAGARLVLDGARSSSDGSCATSASTGSRTSPRPSALLPARRRGRSRRFEDALSDEPAGPGDAVRRARARARRGRRAPRARGRPPADADRPGRHRQDAARAPSGCRSVRRLPRRRLLGAARAAARPGARARRGRAGARSQGRPRGRTSATRGCCCSSTTSSRWSRRRPSSPSCSPRARTSSCSSRAGSCCSFTASRQYPVPPLATPTRSSSSRRGRGRSIQLRADGHDRRALRAARQPAARARARRRPHSRALARAAPRAARASGSTCSRAAATPIRASRRCARRSSGATTCSRADEQRSSRGSPSSPAAARSRRPRRSATPTSTRSSRSSTRASLRAHTGERFWMLETIREFAAERLEAAWRGGRARRRHADFFIAFAEATSRGAADEDVERTRQLYPEVDNFRRALDWLVASGDAERELRLATGAFWCLWTRSSLRELRGWLASALKRAADADAYLRGEALGAAALAASNLGDAEVAQALCSREPRSRA